MASESARSKLAAAILPLPLYQPSDAKQFSSLYRLSHDLPHLIHYYLCQHIFPATMNFQETKISACGHELGSSILFDGRIGFSGTPSNLMPQDLGECQYEPGSDGRVVHVLTDPEVVGASVHSDWSVPELLEKIATSDPPFHALIDSGALITGMENEEVCLSCNFSFFLLFLTFPNRWPDSFLKSCPRGWRESFTSINLIDR